VARAKPCAERAGVGATVRDHVSSEAALCLDVRDERDEVGEALLDREEAEACHRRVARGDGGAEEAVLEREGEASARTEPRREGGGAGLGGLAGDVEEDRRVQPPRPVLVVHPVANGVAAAIVRIRMIEGNGEREGVVRGGREEVEGEAHV